MRPITDILKTGQWKGYPAFVIGSGPSLKGFDYGVLHSQLTIACNESYRKLAATINLVQDVRLFSGDGSVVGLKDRKDWIESNALPVYFRGHPDREQIDANDKIFQVESCHSQENPFSWGSTLEGGLTYGANVGLAAISLGDALGASPLYLLGFDCGFGPKRETHCHQHYPSTWDLNAASQAEVFQRWIKEFTKHSSSVKGQVIVVGPSALTCFKKMSFSEFHEVLP